MGLPSFGVYYGVSIYKDYYSTTIGKGFFSGFTHQNGQFFSYFTSKCKQIYGMLFHHYWQGFFALIFCSVTSNQAKMLPLKMGHLSLEVAFTASQSTIW